MTEQGQTESGHITGVVLPSDQLDITSAGVTPLMLACYNGEVDIVREVLQTGYQTIQVVNSYNASALDYAVDGLQVQVVDLLLGYGADLDAINHDGQGILHRCVLTGQLDKVTMCIQIGVNLDMRNRNGQTALHMAIQKQLVAIVGVLAKNACDKTARNQEGFTAHECAFLSDNLEIQRALPTYPSDPGDELVNHLLYACIQGDVTSIEAIISAYGEQVVQLQGIHNATPVFIASQNGHLNVLRTLCRYKPNVNMTVDEGASPLISAAINNHPEVVWYLIKKGARVNYRNVFGHTALHCAAIEQNIDVVKILVDNGTLVNLKSGNGSTALYIATETNSLDMVKYFGDHGALVDAADKRNVTPLLVAVSENNLEIIQYLIEHGGNLEHFHHSHGTPLMLAVNHNNMAIVQYLVEHGADINKETPDGIAVIDYALGCGNFEIFRYLKDIHNRTMQCTGHQNNEIFNISDVTALQQHLFFMIHNGSGTHDDLKLLIQKGVDINRINNTGRTPLIAAIVESKLEHVAWLIQEQVNVNCSDSSRCPPIIHAVVIDSLAITELLLNCYTVPTFQSHNKSINPTQSQTGGVHPALNPTLAIHHKLQIDQTDSTGKTALSYCAESRNKFADQIATKLINCGANVNIVDGTEQTILEKCIRWGKGELFNLLLENGAQLLPLCPGILIEICLHSDAEILQYCIRHLLASNSKKCAQYITLVLNFTAANLNWVCLKTCLEENKGGLFEMFDTDTLCQMIKLLSPGKLKINCQGENKNNILLIAAEKGVLDVIRVLLDQDVDPKLRNQYSQDVVCLALVSGQYELVSELVSTSLIKLERSDVVTVRPCADLKDSVKECDHKDIQEESHIAGLKSLKSLWAEALELVYDSVISTFIRNPQPFFRGISRGWPDPVLYFHVSEMDSDQCEKYINGIPHIEMYRTELVTAPHLATPLTSTHRTSNTDLPHSLSSQRNSVLCLCKCLMCVFKNCSTGTCWALTTADAVQTLPDNDDHVQTSHMPKQVLKTYVIKKHYGLKSVNVAALLIEHNILRKSNTCLNKLVFHGTDATLLQRKVTKRAPTEGPSEEVQGVIVDVNTSFQDQHGHFYHGAFVVSPVDQNQVFAECGQGGAAVVDTDSDIVLGLVVAAQRDYLGHYKHVTFCIRLDHALVALHEKYNVNIGKFRALQVEYGYV